MSNMDFNNAEPQRAGFGGDLIPNDTVALVVMTIRPGQQGDGGWLKGNNAGDALMIDAEFTVDGGDFDRRKLWGNYIVDGTTDGQQKAAAISRSLLRGMLESAHGIEPGDNSAEALAKRQVTSYGDFSGIRFCARIGVEKGNLKDKTAGPDSERWPDKNIIRAAVTPDDDDYIAPYAGGAASTFKPVGKVAAGVVAKAAQQKAATPAAKPAWAQ